MERITRKEVMKAAKDFGEALFQCKERKALKKAEEAFRNDKDAPSLLTDYQFKQRDLQRARMRGARVPEGAMTELNKLEAEIKANTLIKDVMERRERLQETMQTLNMEISGQLGIDFAGNSSTGGCC